MGLADRVGERGHFDKGRSRVRNLPEFGGELPIATFAEDVFAGHAAAEDAAEDADEGSPALAPIRGLITLAGNPVLSAPNGTRRSADEHVQTGDRYEWRYVHDFGHDGTFTEVAPPRRISFTFGSMHVSLSFREVAGATEVDLHQTGCATEDPDRAWQHVNCRSCWIYFMTNLRSVLAGGPDVRDFENPEWNDSVSIAWGRSAQ